MITIEIHVSTNIDLPVTEDSSRCYLRVLKYLDTHLTVEIPVSNKTYLSGTENLLTWYQMLWYIENCVQPVRWRNSDYRISLASISLYGAIRCLGTLGIVYSR
jgi:hypothetical protein